MTFAFGTKRLRQSTDEFKYEFLLFSDILIFSQFRDCRFFGKKRLRQSVDELLDMIFHVL